MRVPPVNPVPNGPDSTRLSSRSLPRAIPSSAEGRSRRGRSQPCRCPPSGSWRASSPSRPPSSVSRRSLRRLSSRRPGTVCSPSAPSVRPDVPRTRPPNGSPLLPPGDVYGPDRYSAVPDVDWNGSHLVVRPPHLRDLDVADPRIPGHRHQVEVDDAVRDELLHPGVRDLGPEEPGRALRDHQRGAAGPSDDLPE